MLANELLGIQGPDGVRNQVNFVNELFAFSFIFEDNVDGRYLLFEGELDEFDLVFCDKLGIHVMVL